LVDKSQILVIVARRPKVKRKCLLVICSLSEGWMTKRESDSLTLRLARASGHNFRKFTSEKRSSPPGSFLVQPGERWGVDR
jgi:hypothetical protein